MRSVDNWLDRFAYRHPRFGIPNLMRYIVFANVIVFLMDMFSGGQFSALLAFYPGLVMRGQVWRLVTFVFVPEPYELTGLGPVWFAFSMFFYYFLGTTLEREWGSSKFSLFYLCGGVLTLLAGFLSFGLSALLYGDLAQIFSLIPFTMGQVNFSLFLAFATLFPDALIQVYFVIPVKAKWLAVVYLLLQVWDFMRLPGAALLLLLPILLPLKLAALVNYALFFWSDITRVLRRTFARTRHQHSRQTINFKKAAKDARKDKGYLHKCAVCGVTDADNPNMEFRYCSKCNGYYCYCMDHINNHVHIQ